MKPGRELVELVEARVHSGDRVSGRHELLDVLHRRSDHLAQGDEAPAVPLFGHVDHRRLGGVDQIVGVLLFLVAGGDDLGGGKDEPPEQAFFLDDPGVVFDVGAAGHAVHQRGQVGGAAHILQPPLPAKLLADRQKLHRHPAVHEPADRLQDFPMGVLVEILDGHGRENEAVIAGIDQDPAQDRPFRLRAVGRRSFQKQRIQIHRSSFRAFRPAGGLRLPPGEPPFPPAALPRRRRPLGSRPCRRDRP